MGKGKPWTDEEINLLREKYPYCSKKELLIYFTDRTFISIQLKASRLGIDKKFNVDGNEWHKEEIDILCNNYATTSNSDMIKIIPNRTIRSIGTKAERLGLRKEGRKIREEWSDEDSKLFTIYYSHLTTKELIRVFFPNRVKKQIDEKAYDLGLLKSKESKDRANKQKGKILSEKLKGRIVSDETRAKISASAVERYKYNPHNAKGLKRSDETKLKISKAKKELGQWIGKNNPRHKNPLNGELNGRWEGGITAESFKIRNSQEYADWRNKVFSHDNYTCQVCGIEHDNIQAHHIENFATNQFKRFDTNNGITLCKKHHCPTIKSSFHYLYGVRNNTKKQLEGYIANYSN